MASVADTALNHHSLTLGYGIQLPIRIEPSFLGCSVMGEPQAEVLGSITPSANTFGQHSIYRVDDRRFVRGRRYGRWAMGGWSPVSTHAGFRVTAAIRRTICSEHLGKLSHPSIQLCLNRHRMPVAPTRRPVAISSAGQDDDVVFVMNFGTELL